MTKGICDSMKYEITGWDVISEARAVMAEAGPIPNAVQAVITDAADILETPSFIRIGNTDAINNKPKPAADGIQINKSWPIGITITASNWGFFLNKDNGLIAKFTSAEEAPICLIYATKPPIDIIINPTPAFVLAKASFINLKKSSSCDPVVFLTKGTFNSRHQAKSNIKRPEKRRTA